MMNNTIKKWIEALAAKDDTKQQITDGLSKLVQEGNESGVWNMVACASSAWQANVNEIESLRARVNSFEEKEKQLMDSGVFSNEDARLESATTGKRKVG